MHLIKMLFRTIQFNQHIFLRSLSAVAVKGQSEKLTQIVEKDGIRNIILDNPRTRNALSLEMMTQLLADIKRNQNDENLRAIVLSANGPVFSAGHNLKELSTETGSNFHRKVFEKASQLMLEIVQAPVPIIAKVDGLAAAAGCQLIATCDIVVCSEKSTFSTPGANFGIFCSTPGISVARAVPNKKSLYMLLTGFPITAKDAYNCGLVSSIAEDPALLDKEVDRICNGIKTKSRSVIQRGKKFFYEQIQMNLKSAYKYGEQEMIDNLQLKDGQEGVRSFIEKRKPVWSHSIDNIDDR